MKFSKIDNCTPATIADDCLFVGPIFGDALSHLFNKGGYLVDDELKSAVHAALKSWNQEGIVESPLQHLRLFRIAADGQNSNLHSVTKAVITQGLNALETTHPDDANLLRSRFLDEQLVYRIATQENVSEATVYRKQNLAIDQLTNAIHAMEQAAQAEHQQRLTHNLELPTYIQLVGSTASQEHLANLLLLDGPPWIISIEGIGGIGKTSLANSVARVLINRNNWADYGWVTARQAIFNLGGGITPVDYPTLKADLLIDELIEQLMPELAQTSRPQSEKKTALTTKLKAQPHLIVVDNLETVIDLQTLLPLLHELSNPTKFLLTSRESLYGESGVSHFRVPELGQEDSLKLVRLEAEIRSLPHVANATDDELIPIIEIVGGNPLALRLVTGQLHVHPLDEVLFDLHHAGSEVSTNFYTYIYRKAWDDLEEETRNAFLAMPLASRQGITLELLSDISHMERRVLYKALDKLVSLNLVDSHGGLNKRHYTIHNLTRAFLHEQVAQWVPT